MTDQQDNFNLDKVVFDENNQERKSEFVLDNPVPDFWLSFCPKTLWTCSLSLVASGELIFQKFVTNQ